MLDLNKQLAEDSQTSAISLLESKNLLVQKINFVNDHFVVCERRNIACTFITIESRLLRNRSPLGMLMLSQQGSGKTTVIDSALRLYPTACYKRLTTGSPKSLYHSGASLKHKTLVLSEAQALKSKEFSYALHSLLSEGRINYEVAVSAKGGHRTEKINIEGPTSFITTASADYIDPDLRDRLIECSTDTSREQTRRVITLEALKAAGKKGQPSEEACQVWRRAHDMLKPERIIIPFAEQIDSLIQGVPSFRYPVVSRRTVQRLFTVVGAVTCTYQYQREKNSEGQVVADLCDYHMARQIFLPMFEARVRHSSNELEKIIRLIQKNGPVRLKQIADIFGISKQAASKKIATYINDGVLVWCHQDGSEPPTAQLNSLKRSNRAYVNFYPEHDYDGRTHILPTTFDLTGDPAWKEGGDLFTAYDLSLDAAEE